MSFYAKYGSYLKESIDHLKKYKNGKFIIKGKVNLEDFYTIENPIIGIRSENEYLLDFDAIQENYSRKKLSYQSGGLAEFEADQQAKESVIKDIESQYGIKIDKDLFSDSLWVRNFDNKGNLVLLVNVLPKNMSGVGPYLDFLTEAEKESIKNQGINPVEARQEFALYHEHMHNMGTENERICDAFSFLKILHKYKNPALLKFIILPRIEVPVRRLKAIKRQLECGSAQRHTEHNLAYFAPETQAYFLNNADEILEEIKEFSEPELIEKSIEIATPETQKYAAIKTDIFDFIAKHTEEEIWNSDFEIFKNAKILLRMVEQKIATKTVVEKLLENKLQNG